MHPRIEQLRRSRANAPGDRKAAVWRSFQIGIGIDVENANALDAIIIDPPVDRPGIKTTVQVGDDDRLGIDARRAQAQIVAEDAAIAVGEIAVEPHLHQRPARDRVEAADPRRTARNRNDDLIGIDPRLA